jgi:hypothetical protein
MRELFGGLLLLAIGGMIGYFVGHLLFPNTVLVNGSSTVFYPSSSQANEVILEKSNYSFLGESVIEGVISNHSLGWNEGFFEVWRWGNGSFWKKEIWVSNNLSWVRKLFVLSHEYGHSIQFERGWKGELNASEEGSRLVLNKLIGVN